MHELFKNIMGAYITPESENYNMKVSVGFVFTTLVVILVSWLLTIYVDEPFKNFAYEYDMASRVKEEKNKSEIIEETTIEKL